MFTPCGTSSKRRIVVIVLCLGLMVVVGLALAQFPPVIDLSQTTADATVYGAFDKDKTGSKLAAGDVNGDGNVDLVILSPSASPLGRDNVGQVDILWGSTPFDSVVDLLDIAAPVSRILGATGEAGLFSNVACGDLDKDGYDDVVFGVPCKDRFLNCVGKAYIIFGSSEFPDTVDLDIAAQNITRVYGPYGEEGWLGAEITTGDINGDSYLDLIVAAPAMALVFVISGRDSFPPTIDLTTADAGVIRIVDPVFQRATGSGLACGDVDSDGYDDLLLGSPGSNPSFASGKATLLYGAASLPDTILLSDESIGMIHILPVPQYIYGQLGYQMAIADVNRDNYRDLVLSAHSASPLGCLECGEVYIIYTSKVLPDTIRLESTEVPIARLIGAGVSTFYGTELISADVSGDGYADVMIHSEYRSGPPIEPFKITIVYGAASLPDSIFLATDSTVTRILGETSPDKFGAAMVARDFNKDGVSDLAAGAYAADPMGRVNAGKVHLFYGISTLTSVGSPGSIPLFSLFQNRPNPFSSTTTIPYWLGEPLTVELNVYDVRGQRVLRTEILSPAEGPSLLTWNGTDDKGRRLASGVYFYQLRAGGFSETRKLTILR